MMPLLLLLQLSLVVVITHSKWYEGTSVHEETSLSPEDFANAKNGSYLDLIPDDLKSTDHCRTVVDTDGQGHYFGGNDSDAHRTRRNANFNRWEGGRIPYTIDSSYKGWQKAMIAKAMNDIMEDTCVKFVEKGENDSNYVFIGPISGCASDIGPPIHGGKRQVSLTYRCFYPGTILHELMHALGFYHEQRRWDRDDHVNIYWNSIRSDFQEAYQLIPKNYTKIYGEYDLNSVMHYDSWGGCKCTWFWYRTMTTKDGRDIHGATKLSEGDIRKIHAHYNCDGGGTKAPSTGQFHHVYCIP